MIKNQILCFGLSRTEMQTLYVRFPFIYQFYQLRFEDFDDSQKVGQMVRESLCLFINPKKLNTWQMHNLIQAHSLAVEQTHAAILLFTAPFTREQRYLSDAASFHHVNLKARFDKNLRDAVELIRYTTMPCWNKLKQMAGNGFNDGWYLLDPITTGLDPLSDELIGFSIAYMANYAVYERTTIYIKPNRPIPAEDEARSGITNKMLNNGISKEEAITFLETLPHPAPFIIDTETHDYPFLKALYHFCGKKFDLPFMAIGSLSAIVFGHKLLRRRSDLVRTISCRKYPRTPVDDPYLAEMYDLTLAVFENLQDRYDIRCPGHLPSLYWSDTHSFD